MKQSRTFTAMKRLLPLSMLLPLFGHAATTSDQGIVLLYVERPPLMMHKPGAAREMDGVLVKVAEDALRKAGVPFSWREESPNRELAVIRKSEEPVCAIGRYRIPERVQYAKFSHPIYRDRVHVGIANVNFNIGTNARLTDLFADPDVTILMRDGYVLPNYIENLTANMKAKRIGTYGTYAQMINQVIAGKAQITIITSEEEAYFRNLHPVAPGPYKVVHFSDVPPGDTRYLMCSKSVPDSVIARINAVLK